MKKPWIIIGLVLALVYGMYVSAWGLSTGISGRAVTGCGGDSCHTPDTETTATVSISGPDTITAGESGAYTVTIDGTRTIGAESTETTQAGLNFKLSAGEFIAGLNTVTTGTTSSVEITHSTDTVTSFRFQIKAPDDATSTITLSGFGLAANGNDSNSGDAWAFSSKTIGVALPTTPTPEPTTTTTTLAPATTTTTTRPTTTSTTVLGTTTTTLCRNLRDLPSGAWFKRYVDNLFSRQIVHGYPNCEFRPQNRITRAEFAKLVILALGERQSTETTSSFTDVPRTHWAFGFIHKAKQLGIIQGFPTGDFRPDNFISRQEMAQMLIKAKKTTPVTNFRNVFPDVPSSLMSWPFILKVRDLNLMIGYPNGQFKPLNFATRAEAAKTISVFTGFR